jgi:hypothetical protein
VSPPPFLCLLQCYCIQYAGKCQYTKILFSIRYFTVEESRTRPPLGFKRALRFVCFCGVVRGFVGMPKKGSTINRESSVYRRSCSQPTPAGDCSPTDYLFFGQRPTFGLSHKGVKHLAHFLGFRANRPGQASPQRRHFHASIVVRMLFFSIP